MVIPSIEEGVIVTKRRVLVEEVREPQSVKLRREEVVVHRDTQNQDDQ